MVLVWHHSTLEVKVSCVRRALKTIAACLSAGIKGLRHPLPEAASSQNSKVFLPSLRIGGGSKEPLLPGVAAWATL